MIRASLLAAALAAAMPCAVLAADPVDLGAGVSEYQRFMAYPHLQRGFDALSRADVPDAVDAFERARRYTPRSAVTALYLADAYRRAGRAADAERVLAEQRRYTPNDPRLARTPRPAVDRGVTPVAVAPAKPLVAEAVAASPAKVFAPRRARAAAAAAPIDAVSSARASRDIQAAIDANDIGGAEALLAALPPTSFPEARITVDLARGRRASALSRVHRLLSSAPRDVALLDRLTFRLIAANERAAATRILLDAWPTVVAPSPTLASRLAALLADRPTLAGPMDRERLARPLASTTELASQAQVLAAVGDCGALVSLLTRTADAAPRDAWASAGRCGGDAVSLDFLHTAAAKSGDEDLARRLAFRAYDARDFARALQAWKTIPPSHMDGPQLLAAARTAIDAGVPVDSVRWLDEFEQRGFVADDSYWWLRSLAASRGSHDERAALDRALALREDPRYLARLAQLQAAEGDAPAALRSLERARALAPDDVGVAASLGYALAAAGRPRDAVPLLEAYQAAHSGEAPVAEDLAELERRVVRKPVARAYARTAIDLLDAQAEPDRVFRLRRLHEQLGRQWAVSADITLGNTVGSAAAATPGAAYRSYAQVEVDRWLGEYIGRPDGDALTAYARVFAGAQGGGVAPNDLPTLGVGVRWKPFEARLVYVAVERQLALDARTQRGDDTLVRISAAPLTDPRFSQDWHAAGPGWWSHTVYLDAAHYLTSGDIAATADYQVGRHFKLGQAQTLEPYGRAQWNGRWSGNGFETDSRIGLGLRWNRWYGGDAYDAWPHRLVLGVEAQQALSTYLPERRAFFVNIGSYW
jgi:adsorption protein A